MYIHIYIHVHIYNVLITRKYATTQHTATRCNTLQHIVARETRLSLARVYTHIYCDTLQLTASNTLQRTATHCNALQHTVARETGLSLAHAERWGAGVETQKNVRGEIGGWGRVPFYATYTPSLSTIYDGA